MSYRDLVVALLVVASVLVFPEAASAQTSFRTKMLIAANIDGYASDDDATAITRFLRASGDSGGSVPADIADWIVTRIGDFGGRATPRLIDGYVHFLRAGVSAPPFPCGDAASPRYRLLRAMVGDLVAHNTPLANLGLLMFLEADDNRLRQVANAADYTPIRSFPWEIGSGIWGSADWMDWILSGLPENRNAPHPTEGTPPAIPPAAPRTDANLLPHVRTFLSALDFRPPVSRSDLNFTRFAHSPNEQHSWASLIGANHGVGIDQQQQTAQLRSLVSAMSASVAAFLGVPQLPLQGAVAEAAGNAWLSGLLSRTFAATTFVYLTAQGSSGRRRSTDDLNSLAGVIGGQQSRIFALAAYGLLAYGRRHNAAAQDLPMDQLVISLAHLSVPAGEAKTTVVPSFMPQDLTGAQYPDLSLLSRCDPSTGRLSSRRVSLRDHVYLETIAAQCTDHSEASLSLMGSIPTDLVRMLDINPNYLDIVGVSLAARDAGRTQADDSDPDDISLVENDPWTSVAYCLAALQHPEAPWRYTRDVLLAHYPRSLQWFLPGWRPALLDDSRNRPFPYDGRVLVTPDEFDLQKKVFLYREQAFVQDDALRRFLREVGPIVNAMDDSQTVCHALPPQQGQGESCSNQPTQRHALIMQLNALAQQVVGGQSPVSGPRCTAPDRYDFDRMTTVINQATNEILIRYQSGDCEPAAPSTLALSPPAKALLMSALENDPLFLNRWQVDLVTATGDAAARAARIVGAAGSESALAFAMLSGLERSGLIWYLPDIQAPLRSISDAWEAIPRDLILKESSPLLATPAPLLRTAAALDLAADLATLQGIQANLPAEKAQRPRHPDDVIAQLRTAESGIVMQMHASVDTQVANIRNAINAQQNNFAFGISVGIGPTGIVPGLSFTLNGVGINVALQLPAVVLSPIIPSFALPGVPFVFPGTGALAPVFAPQVPIPLAERAPAPGLNRAPAGLADPPPPPGQVTVTLPPIDWGSVLAQNNPTGRDWLNREIRLATPLLTAAQLDAITQALQLPTFPSDLAQLVAQKAIEAAGAAAPPPPGTPAPIVQTTCANQVWSNCGIEIKKALDNTQDLDQAVALAAIWSDAFNRAYDDLRKTGRLERAVPESERISEVLNENFNPADILADHVQDVAVEHYFPRLAPLWKWAKNPIVVALRAFFDSQDIGTDLDDLLTMDDAIQESIGTIIRPHLKPDWQERLSGLVTRSTPALQAPGH